MRTSWIGRLQPAVVQSYILTHAMAQSASESMMTIIGWTLVSIDIESYLAVVQFLVVENLIAECGVILGLHWLDDND